MNDICINRHQGNPQSQFANKKVMKQKDRQFIVDYLTQNGKSYSKRIARAMNKQLNQISGRLSELKAEGIIEGTDEVVEGCQVYQLVKQQSLFQ